MQRIIPVDDSSSLSLVFGIEDKNLKFLEKELSVSIAIKPQGLSLSGKKGDIDKQIDNLQSALSASPDLPSAFLKLSRIYLEQGEISKAIELAKRLIELRPNSIIAHVARVGSNYGGNSTQYMNQWFRLNGYKLQDVQSVQLEFRLKGIRRSEDLDKASRNISNALSDFSIYQ